MIFRLPLCVSHRQPENENTIEADTELDPVAFSEVMPTKPKQPSPLERKIAETKANKDFFRVYDASFSQIFAETDNCEEIQAKLDQEAEKQGIDIAKLKAIEAEMLAKESAELFKAEDIDDEAEAEIMAFEISFIQEPEINSILPDNAEDNQIISADDLSDIDDDETHLYEETY